ADAPREEDAVAVERQKRVLELMEPLEVVRQRDADGRAVVPVAPGEVVRLLDLDDARVVAVDEFGEVGIAADEADRLRIDLPLDAVVAEAAVQPHRARPVVAAEDAGVPVAEANDGAVEDAVRGRKRVAANHRVARVAPDDLTRPLAAVLPRQRCERGGHAATRTRCSESTSTSRASSASTTTATSAAAYSASTSSQRRSRCGTEASSDLVYGCRGSPNTLRVRPLSTTTPRRRISVRSLM